MLEINKILAIPQGPFDRGIDLKILNKVEEIVQFQVMWVDYQELKPNPKNGCRRFLIRAAYGSRDKD